MDTAIELTESPSAKTLRSDDCGTPKVDTDFSRTESNESCSQSEGRGDPSQERPSAAKVLLLMAKSPRTLVASCATMIVG